MGYIDPAQLRYPHASARGLQVVAKAYGDLFMVKITMQNVTQTYVDTITVDTVLQKQNADN